MPQIAYKFSVNALPARVYEALTDQKHVSQWWTPDCTMDRKTGGRAKFEFKSSSGALDGYAIMRIEKLIPNKLVEWKCTEQDYQGVSDWVGTTIRFRLSPNPADGTDVDFAHLDWQNREGSFRRCTDGWNHVLITSLKNYIEKGKGEPYLAHLETEGRQDPDAIVSEIEIATPPGRVFKAITDAKEVLRRAPALDAYEMDARFGGQWFLEMRPTQPHHGFDVIRHEGEILEIDPPRLLVYTWFANFHDDPKHRSVVRWELTPTPSGTHVKVTHSGLTAEPQARKDYASGWPGVLEDLRRWVEKSPNEGNR